VIPNAVARDVKTSGVTDSSEFGISLKDSAHIMTILRDTLYSDKVLAVLREYGANAWDAHREVKKYTVPIKVVLPTLSEPTLVIQDYGRGLSHQEVFEIYTKYGASTKRDSDDSVGMLGIGSKSGFAYSDSFTVVSCHGGKRRTYVAVLDDSERGQINLLAEEECGDETGIAVHIPVKSEDIWEFTFKAKDLYKYFVPQPDINVQLDDIQQTILTNGAIFNNGKHDGWVAVMGCVPYRINLNQIKGPNAPDGGIADYIFNLSGALYFNIGEVQISASREELKYSNKTKKALVQRFELLVEEFVRTTLSSLEAGGFSLWEKRVRAQILSVMDLPVPKECKDLLCSSISINSDTKFFRVTRGSNSTPITTISVDAKSRFLIRDDTRPIPGYGLVETDYVVRPELNATLDEIKAELDEVINDCGLIGISIANITTIPWFPPAQNPKIDKIANRKHQVKTFRLKDLKHYSNPWSNNWDIESRVATPEDVFVVINGFKSEGGFDIYRYVDEDQKLAKEFGATLPPIYGYKTTTNKPIKPENCLGIHYPEWRKKFAESLITKDIKRKIKHREWADAVSTGGYYNRSSWKAYHILRDGLGKLHPISLLVKKSLDAERKKRELPYSTIQAIHNLLCRLERDHNYKSDAVLAMEDIHVKYPLLPLDNVGIERLWGEDSNVWIEYVKIIDSLPSTETKEEDNGEDSSLRSNQ
jgi:hypothetical protein